MNTLIHYRVEENLALIGLARPPVNALGQALRAALAEAYDRAIADPDVRAIVLYGEGRAFSAGADIAEFGSASAFATPDLASLLNRLSQSEKPLIAAIGGLALGGGLEVALACGYRISEVSARLGLPEAKIGLLPGAGGTQRLPRLVGAEVALDMILSGEPVWAVRAREIGLVDRLVKGQQTLLDAACDFARELLTQAAPAQPAWRRPQPEDQLPAGFFDDFERARAARWRGQIAPGLALAAVKAACELPLEQGLAHEQVLFKQVEASPQSAALRHQFFAQREAAKISGVSSDTPLRTIDAVAIIGAGTMGGGIAMNFANAGIPVKLLELKAEALDRGLIQIRKVYETSVKRGKLSAQALESRMALISGTLDYADIAEADLVIEAVFESLTVKQAVFRTLDEVCKHGAILASNTSTLDVDLIAQVTRRPEDVIGLHFFSPANVMRLLEVVRGKQTAPSVLATTLALAKRIEKVAVVSGVCFGFIGNRMLEPYAREAHRLILEGATPAQVDGVLTELGLAMGVLSMYDLAGIDVGYLVRESRREAIAHDPSYCKLADELYARGHYGQKTGRGFYRYEGRERQEDYEVIACAEVLAAELEISRRAISNQEIHDRCLFMLINEGFQLLDEGIAERSGDIDLVWVNGYGFPAWQGGPMYYAEQLGLEKVLAGIEHYREQLGSYGDMWFTPADLLKRLVAAKKTHIHTL
ncbi:3-hydroxyacyl-CoA dehydrogenase [Pseudomonas sp. ADAK2]|uniref:3-hydroxyacyl-CoA dehydrogenase NAD-binding domain-containing protein n=1 Tax=unclassified Pseudomonas TaxID=196821 RepID=UPI0014632492|nr:MULTISPECIES: 3-hydroxyacyl-CoA dehydrogenase NAD-binding domain-containing protein [unclassified Pseudomonas]QJI40153.1 3-hydroxyacyl-CoA dehydrogenase [Pseudomonas sp. ADAK7]QJI46458.1 3-hydroxyacyl-CoA dehydrogenase [Pseudomonas sp. ADAK2]